MIRKAFNKFMIFLSLTILIFVSAVLIQFFNFRTQAINLNQDSITFTIQPGSHIRQVANQLQQQKLIDDKWLFVFLAKLNKVEDQIKVGEYELKSGMTPEQLLQIFVKGRSIQYRQSIIEGRNFKELLSDIKQNSNFIHTLSDKSIEEIMADIGAIGVKPEGQFLPDTYSFPKGSKDIDYLKRAYLAMQKALEKEWQQRDKNLPLKTPYEALILASIIEKETGVGFERPLISAAFIQRLNKNMRLQTDPTVIYGMGDRYKGNIRYKHLREDTPYNTYVHKGLPPTPIAMPGLLAIQAALHPADSKAIYFVAKGDGTHYFSETLDEHNKAVRKYQLKGRKPKRKATSGN